MMSVDDTLMCSFQILKPADKKPPRFQQSAPGAGGYGVGSPMVGGPAAGAVPSMYGPGGGAASTAGATPGGAGAGGRPSTPPKGPGAAPPSKKK